MNESKGGQGEKRMNSVQKATGNISESEAFVQSGPSRRSSSFSLLFSEIGQGNALHIISHTPSHQFTSIHISKFNGEPISMREM